ncbi:MAG TPA: hypothetical protein D7I06_07715 [Candidatus Poseidoniales archaeon]|nr:MAG TPA: hypothetical protein D7I06_07715 [Candidatus Poseidoniales archaeon]HII63477.1 hypothetical protein [Candidatus Poseidoniaceae archaeon]
MRIALVAILLMSVMNPLFTQVELQDEAPMLLADGNGVQVIEEIEPNNVNTTGQEVYPGDVVRGAVDMWEDKHDWYSVWLEPGQTLLLTLSHASGDGVSMSVWDEENTHYNTTNPSKTRDTIFLGEEETSVGGVYSVSVNATMTEAGGGAYVLEIDAGYGVQWYAPDAGWYVAAQTYDAKGNLMYNSTLSSFQFANAATTNDQNAPVWTNGDFWNFSISMPTFFGVTYEEYHQMTVTGTDSVSGKECYRVSIAGKSTLTMNLMGTETKTIDEETGEACYAKETLSLVHENLTHTSTIEMSGGFSAMSDTSGRSCTDDFGDPDSDCDGVTDDWDDCPDTASGAEVDAWGCSDAQNNGGGGSGGGDEDTDGDGIPDSNDNCPNEYADSSNDADNDGCVDDSGDGNGGGTSDADNDGVVDEDDMCPDTPNGESVDMMGCSDSQGGNSGGNGNGGGMGDGTGGGGTIADGCIPQGVDQSTTMKMDLTYANGINEFNFPMDEGKVWSEASEGSGTISMKLLMGGCTMLDFEFEDSGALPLNYQHIGTQNFEVSGNMITANGIQSFAGREGNNDWATPDFTILPSAPDNVAKYGLPFAAWINVVGFNEFNSTVDISASVNAENAPLMYDNQQLTINDLGAVIIDTMNLSSGDYVLTITGEQDGRERSVTVPFTVDNTPDFEIQTMDPWIVLPGGVPWVVPTPIFIEPVNGFGADVSLSAVVPEGVTATLDFASGTAPFMAVLTLTIADNLSEGDYTVVISGTSGDTVRSDEITFSITSLPEFSLEIDNREQLLAEGEMAISGVIDSHNGLDLSMGGMLDIIVEPYNQALIDSAVITWGDVDANGDLSFSVTFDVGADIPLNEYTIQLNVVSMDGGIAHAASVAFVTKSSTLDGTATVADASVVVSGNTSQHDGKDTTSADLISDTEENEGGENQDSTKDDVSSDSDTKSSNTILIVGSSIGVLGVIIGVAIVILRGRGENGLSNDFSQQLWNEGGNQSLQTMMQPDMMAQTTPSQPIVQQPVQAIAPAPALELATAPPPPMQPTTVSDYTGLPPGGQYEQANGQTVYLQQDGVRWQMMSDGSFNRLN